MVSIIVPLYNYAQYIKENIEFVLKQTYTNWEMIIVDDCSSDNPEAIIQPFLSDSRIRYLRLDNNVGYSCAKNAGIRASHGEYITTLDADDLFTKKSLEMRLKYLKKTGAKWVHAKAYEFSGNKLDKYQFRKRRSIKRLEYILKTGDISDLWRSIHAQTVMIHRSIYEKVGLYEPCLRTMGDKEMWARIINNCGPPVFLNKFVAYYRQHSKQMHRSKHKKKNFDKYKRILHECINKRKYDLSDVERL